VEKQLVPLVAHLARRLPSEHDHIKHSQKPGVWEYHSGFTGKGGREGGSEMGSQIYDLIHNAED
jgi:hypothetical protein